MKTRGSLQIDLLPYIDTSPYLTYHPPRSYVSISFSPMYVFPPCHPLLHTSLFLPFTLLQPLLSTKRYVRISYLCQVIRLILLILLSCYRLCMYVHMYNTSCLYITQAKILCQAIVHSLKTGDWTPVQLKKKKPPCYRGGWGVVPTNVSGTVLYDRVFLSVSFLWSSRKLVEKVRELLVNNKCQR